MEVNKIMAKQSKTWLIPVLALIVGGVLGAVFFPNETEVNVPVDATQESCSKYIPAPVECAACAECEVCETSIDYLDLAKVEAMKEIKDHYAYGYDDDQIKWYGSVEEYSVVFTDDGYTVLFESDIKYKDDVDKEVHEFEFEVTYDEDDEDFDVDVSEI
jgi:hypothetical protein